MKDILIFAGQSNMQGQSECLLSSAPVPGAEEYRYLTDSLVPLADPVGECIRYDGAEGRPILATDDLAAVLPGYLSVTALGAACYGHSSLVPAFCRAYLAKAGGNIVAIHAARGSTRACDWLPGTDGYRVFLAKIKAGIAKTAETDSVGSVRLVFLQGENDELAGTEAAVYEHQLVTLCEALKREIGLMTFSVIRVGPFAGDARDNVIQNAQDHLCETNGDFLMLTHLADELFSDPSAMNPTIGGHFSADGLSRLGEAAGCALGSFAGRMEK